MSAFMKQEIMKLYGRCADIGITMTENVGLASILCAKCVRGPIYSQSYLAGLFLVRG